MVYNGPYPNVFCIQHGESIRYILSCEAHVCTRLGLSLIRSWKMVSSLFKHHSTIYLLNIDVQGPDLPCRLRYPRSPFNFWLGCPGSLSTSKTRDSWVTINLLDWDVLGYYQLSGLRFPGAPYTFWTEMSWVHIYHLYLGVLGQSLLPRQRCLYWNVLGPHLPSRLICPGSPSTFCTERSLVTISLLDRDILGHPLPCGLRCLGSPSIS